MILDSSSSKYKSNSRLHAIDICRGLALLLMIEAHIPQSMGWISNWSSIMAPPFFLIISGLSYDLFLSSRVNTEVKKYIFLESLFRGFFIYTIPLIPYIIVGLFFISYFTFVTGNAYEINVFHWGIFQIIGIGYIFGLLVPDNLKSKLFAIILIFIFSHIINNLFQETFYFLVTGSFPLFPWIGYFLFGRIAYELYQGKYLNNDTELLIFSILFSIISLLIFNALKVEFSTFTRNQVPMFLLLSSILFLIFSLLIIYIDHKHLHINMIYPLEKIGRICFTAYYIHFLIIFAIEKFASVYFNCFPPPISNLIIFIIIVFILTQIEEIWKNYNYIFGFEWFTRKMTDKMLKLCKLYL